MDPRDKFCRTPLFLAAGAGGTEAVQMLIDSGADVTVKDVDLRSCVRAAVGQAGTMEVLLQVRNIRISDGNFRRGYPTGSFLLNLQFKHLTDGNLTTN